VPLLPYRFRLPLPPVKSVYGNRLRASRIIFHKIIQNQIRMHDFKNKNMIILIMTLI
jgi:hypothetical protein